VLVGALTLVAVASAQPPARSPQQLNLARELYQKATRHYELGEYNRAIDEYKRAYEISAAPALLFNLGQVYRLKKDPVQALRFYGNYLRLNPNADNRADVEALMREMREDIAAEEKARAKPTPPPVVTPPVVTAPPVVTPPVVTPPTVVTATPRPPVEPTPIATGKPSPPRGQRWRAELWTANALGVVGLGVTIAGIAVGVRANSDAADIQNAAATNAQAWTAMRQNEYRDGQRSAAAATALYVIGPALIVAGAAVGIVAWRDHRLARRLALSPSRQGIACVF
jgi:tetratricopeptide (TPR) repeat protein